MSIAFALASARGAPAASTWPTLHKDNQRSGYTDEVIEGPYERKWYRDFHDEMIATRVEAIVAEGKCYVGTFAGNFYALDVTDGSTVWKFEAASPIGHSGCYEKGRLYFGCDEGFDKGRLYCLGASDGRKLWEYQAGGGVWVAPACDGEKVYFGDRAGAFHAVSADTGKKVWTYKTGYMILTPASLSPDGKRIVFASEDMHVYCVDPEGRLLWKSQKCGGLTLRDHPPTLWRGLAIVRTNPAMDFHGAQKMEILKKLQKSIPIGPDDKVIRDKWGTYSLKPTPKRVKAETEAVLEHLGKNRAEKTFYAFRLDDGAEPWTAPITYIAMGLHNPPGAPTFNPETGELYTWYGTCFSNYSAGVPGGCQSLAKVDPKTGRLAPIWHRNGDRIGWSGQFSPPADESQALSLMGHVILNTHQGIVGGMDLRTLKWHTIYSARDTYGGIFGPAAVVKHLGGNMWGKDSTPRRKAREGYLVNTANEWHGPDSSIVSVAERRFFWSTGSQVVCVGGPDTRKTATGGTEAPEPYKRRLPPLVGGGNVTALELGGFDGAAEKIAITSEEMLRLVSRAPGRVVRTTPSTRPGRARQSSTALARELRGRLDAELEELVDGWPWAPFIVELGLSGEERHFWRAADTMQLVSLAIPHLSAGVQAKAVRFLKALVKAGCPLRAPYHTGTRGKRREIHDLGPDMAAFARSNPRYSANVEDLYALWAYAHYADAYDDVVGQVDAIRRVYDEFARQPVSFDHKDKDNDAAEHLNGQLAGTLAYARIMARARQPAEVERATKRLAELATERVHHERADTNFVRSTKVAAKKLHQAKIPRYVALAPEVGAILREHARVELERNVRGLMIQLPVWYQAFGERLIGGENYISPPHLARGLFAALADGLQAKPAELVRFLDQPWCRADLYYIEKLSAILRALDAAR